jgi:hypothetical protein
LDQIGTGSRTRKKSPPTERTIPGIIPVAGVAANIASRPEKRRASGHACRPRAGGGGIERPVARLILVGQNCSSAVQWQSLRPPLAQGRRSDRTASSGGPKGKARNRSRVAEALPHREGIAYKPPCGEITMCPRVGRMGPNKR